MHPIQSKAYQFAYMCVDLGDNHERKAGNILDEWVQLAGINSWCGFENRCGGIAWVVLQAGPNWVEDWLEVWERIARILQASVRSVSDRHCNISTFRTGIQGNIKSDIKSKAGTAHLAHGEHVENGKPHCPNVPWLRVRTSTAADLSSRHHHVLAYKRNQATFVAFLYGKKLCPRPPQAFFRAYRGIFYHDIALCRVSHQNRRDIYPILKASDDKLPQRLNPWPLVLLKWVSTHV